MEIRNILPDTLLKYRTLVLSVFILLFLVAGFFLTRTFFTSSNKIDAEAEYAFRAHELSPFLTGEVQLKDGVSYRLVNDAVRNSRGEKADVETALTVLRTMQYATQTRLDPIFSIEGTHPSLFTSAVEDLFSTTDTFEPFYTEKEMETIRTVLYPKRFLSTLADLERARRSLVNTPTSQNVRSYNAQLKKTLAAYQKDVFRMRNAFIEFTKNDSRTYGFPVGVTSPGHIQQTLAELSSRIARKETQRKQRFSCFRGIYEKCKSLSASLNQLAFVPHHGGGEPNYVSPSYAERQILSLLSFEHEHSSSSLHPIQGGHNTTDSYRTVFLSDPVCAFDSGGARFAIWHDKTTTGNAALRYHELEDMFFVDVEAASEGSAFFSHFQEKGHEYLHQSITNMYMCPDNGKDLSRIQTLRFVHDTLKNTPLFLDQTALDVPSLKALEARITQSTHLQEEQIVSFLSAAGELLSVHGERGLAEKLGERKVEMLEQMLRIQRSNTAMFEQIVSNVAHLNRFLPMLIQNDNVPVVQFSVNRNAFMTFLMPFNKTVVDSPPSFFLRKQQKDTALKNFFYLSYENTLQHQYTDAELADMLIRGHREQDMLEYN